MISFKSLLREAMAILEKDAEQIVASKVAKDMGLIYKGFGRWADPKTNKIVAKTIDGKLVRIEPEDDVANPAADAESERGMYQASSKLDAPSGVPFGNDNPQNRTKATAEITSRLRKNIKSISADPAKEAKAVALVKRIATSSGMKHEDDIAAFDQTVSTGGLDAALKMNKLVNDTIQPDGRYTADFEYEKDNSKYNDPNEIASASEEFDTLGDLWNSVTWATDPRTGEPQWSYKPNTSDDY